MRKEFGKAIVELAEKDNKIFLLVGDIGYGVFDEFRKKFPNRFINMGICEQSMISVAAGMALEGLKPYVYTITPFLIERPFEQVKLDIDQQNVNVKLVGYADYPEQGPTHAELDAQHLMKLFKNIISYFPKNSNETKEALIKAYNSSRPAFISLKKDKSLHL
jgi:transketolase